MADPTDESDSETQRDKCQFWRMVGEMDEKRDGP